MDERAVESNFAGQGSLSLFKRAGQLQHDLNQGEVGGTSPFKTMIGVGVILIGLGICFGGLALTLREIRKFGKRKNRKAASSWEGQQQQQQPTVVSSPPQQYAQYSAFAQ